MPKAKTKSFKKQLHSELTGDNPLSNEVIAYLEQRAIGEFYHYVLSRIESEGEPISARAHFAKRVRLTPNQLNRLLASPATWTIRTVARLLAGIGEEPVLSSRILLPPDKEA